MALMSFVSGTRSRKEVVVGRSCSQYRLGEKIRTSESVGQNMDALRSRNLRSASSGNGNNNQHPASSLQVLKLRGTPKTFCWTGQSSSSCLACLCAECLRCKAVAIGATEALFVARVTARTTPTASIRVHRSFSPNAQNHTSASVTSTGNTQPWQQQQPH